MVANDWKRFQASGCIKSHRRSTTDAHLDAVLLEPFGEYVFSLLPEPRESRRRMARILLFALAEDGEVDPFFLYVLALEVRISTWSPLATLMAPSGTNMVLPWLQCGGCQGI